MRAIGLFTLVLISMLGCGKKTTEEVDKKPLPAPVKVPLAVASEELTPQQVTLSGVVAADQRAEVTADTAGKVINVMVERGKRVKQGDPVVQLDVRNATLGAREAQANLASARAQRELAEEECKRTKALLDKGAITKSEYDRQITACTSALQQVSAAEARTQMMMKSVTDGMVRAPFDGVVAEKMVAPGEWVAPGRPLFTLVDDSPLKIELSVSEIGVRAVRPDQRVELYAVADPDHAHGATVTRIGAEIGRTRSLIVEARIDDNTPLVPGMFAEARVTIGQVRLPVIPKTALRGKCGMEPRVGPTKDDPTRGYGLEEKCRAPWRVFVVVKGELEERIVQLGPEMPDGRVAVAQNLKAGEKVVADATVKKKATDAKDTKDAKPKDPNAKVEPEGPEIVDGLRVVE